MVRQIHFSIDTALSVSLIELIHRLDLSLQLNEPVKMVIAGGMAVHLYTASRVTTDVDAEFSKRFIVPDDLVVETADGNMLYLDGSYNSSFALMHENYLDDAVPVPVGTAKIEVFVLSPVDLIVSKIARLSGPDMDDIKSLIWNLGISPAEIEARSSEALHGYIGNMSTVKMNLADVLAVASEWANNYKPV